MRCAHLYQNKHRRCPICHRIGQKYGASALNELFTGAVEATEEAVYNALEAAVTTYGVDGHVLRAIPHDRLRSILARR